jgi:hypothetical protein
LKRLDLDLNLKQPAKNGDYKEDIKHCYRERRREIGILKRRQSFSKFLILRISITINTNIFPIISQNIIGLNTLLYLRVSTL